MSEQMPYKEEIIKLLDNLNEIELQGLYLALSGPIEMDVDVEEEAFLDDRSITELTVGEFLRIIYETVQTAMEEVLMDFSMEDLSGEDIESMGDFFEAFQRFLEEGSFEEDAFDEDFDEFDDDESLPS